MSEKKTRGGAYILVVIVMLTVFVITAASLNISHYEMQITNSYTANANGYHLAEGGIKSAENLLNSLLTSCYQSIAEDTFGKIKEMDIDAICVYKTENAPDFYEGTFYLKNPDTGGIRGEQNTLFKTIFGRLADDFIRNILIDRYEYGLRLNDSKNSAYTVTVEISYLDGGFYIQSKALNSLTGAAEKVLAHIAITYDAGIETFTERYAWKLVPGWAAGPNIPGGESCVELSVLDLSFCEEVLFDTAADVTGLSYPVIIADSYMISDKTDPEYLIVINPFGDLIIRPHTSIAGTGYFCGVAAASGDIVFEGGNIEIKGAIAAGGVIKHEDAVVKLTPMPEAVFLPDIGTCAQRRLFDYLNITRYAEACGTDIYGTEVLSPNAAMSIKSLNIEHSDRLRYEIQSLKKTFE